MKNRTFTEELEKCYFYKIFDNFDTIRKSNVPGRIWSHWNQLFPNRISTYLFISCPLVELSRYRTWLPLESSSTSRGRRTSPDIVVEGRVGAETVALGEKQSLGWPEHCRVETGRGRRETDEEDRRGWREGGREVKDRGLTPTNTEGLGMRDFPPIFMNYTAKSF